jgi:hypothetical protein
VPEKAAGWQAGSQLCELVLVLVRLDQVASRIVKPLSTRVVVSDGQNDWRVPGIERGLTRSGLMKISTGSIKTRLSAPRGPRSRFPKELFV